MPWTLMVTGCGLWVDASITCSRHHVQFQREMLVLLQLLNQLPISGRRMNSRSDLAVERLLDQ